MWALRLASRALPDIILLIKRLWMLLCCKISNFQVSQLCCGVWWGKMPSPHPDFGQRWMVNVPKFRFKCLLPIDNYKPQPHDPTLGQCCLFKTRAAASWQLPFISSPGLRIRGKLQFDGVPICKQTISILTVKQVQGSHRSQGQTVQGQKQPLPLSSHVTWSNFPTTFVPPFPYV